MKYTAFQEGERWFGFRAAKAMKTYHFPFNADSPYQKDLAHPHFYLFVDK